jgi:hypothetical protein
LEVRIKVVERTWHIHDSPGQNPALTVLCVPYSGPDCVTSGLYCLISGLDCLICATADTERLGGIEERRLEVRIKAR